MDKTPENPTASMFPVCWSCPERIVQPDLINPDYSHVAGCRLLNKPKWDNGVAEDSLGHVYQKNCPKRL
jgi:hypothetical protein